MISRCRAQLLLVNPASMSQQIVILKPDNIEQVLTLDSMRLSKLHSDPVDLEFAKWQSRSRREAVEHYLPMGWSFGLWRDTELLGYFLAQPLLFYSGMTQSLWIEAVVSGDTAVDFQLIDTAVRLAREKHFQQVLFSDCEKHMSLLKDLKGLPLTDTIFMVRTTKSV